MASSLLRHWHDRRRPDQCWRQVWGYAEIVALEVLFTRSMPGQGSRKMAPALLQCRAGSANICPFRRARIHVHFCSLLSLCF